MFAAASFGTASAIYIDPPAGTAEVGGVIHPSESEGYIKTVPQSFGPSGTATPAGSNAASDSKGAWEAVENTAGVDSAVVAN